MENFKTLNIAKDLYKEGKRLNLRGNVANQFNRASLSVVLNLAEGNGKRTYKDRRRFFYIAYGSYNEVKVILEISGFKSIIERYDILGAHLWKLCQNPGGT